MQVLGGILVGGAARRMNGAPKGLLRAPSGETIVERWRSLFGALGIQCVLVGGSGAYRHLGFESIDDEPPGIGPLGGLIALFARAGDRQALAVGCDMPFVSAALLTRLVQHPSTTVALAPNDGGRWEPLFARYRSFEARAVAQKRAARGDRSLQGLLTDLGAEALPLTGSELGELRDWDAPGDFLR